MPKSMPTFGYRGFDECENPNSLENVKKRVGHAKNDHRYENMPIMKKPLTEDEFVALKSKIPSPELRGLNEEEKCEALKKEFYDRCKNGNPPNLLDIETDVRVHYAYSGIPAYVVCPRGAYRNEQYQEMQKANEVNIDLNI